MPWKCTTLHPEGHEIVGRPNLTRRVVMLPKPVDDWIQAQAQLAGISVSELLRTIVTAAHKQDKAGT